MAIIYSYPRIDEVQGSDLILVADASKRNQTKSASVSQLLTGQATVVYVDDRVVTSASFSTSNGVLTLTRNSGEIPDVTVDLDGRYALTTAVFSGNYNDLTNTPTIPPAYGDSDVDTHLNTSTADNNQVLSWTGEAYDWVDQSSGGGGGGTVTSIATTAPITGGTITGAGTIGINQATTNTDGYLSSTDWNTFNSKSSFDGQYSSLTGKPTIPAAYTDADVDTRLNTSTATASQVLSWTGSDYDWVAQSGGGGGNGIIGTSGDANIAAITEIRTLTQAQYDDTTNKLDNVMYVIL